MSIESYIITALKKKQADLAHDALARPAGTEPAFHYGLAAGKHAGLQMALDEIATILENEKEDRGEHRRGENQPLIRPNF